MFEGIYNVVIIVYNTLKLLNILWTEVADTPDPFANGVMLLNC